jgi:hypothetical protein
MNSMDIVNLMMAFGVSKPDALTILEHSQAAAHAGKEAIDLRLEQLPINQRLIAAIIAGTVLAEACVEHNDAFLGRAIASAVNGDEPHGSC